MGEALDSDIYGQSFADLQVSHNGLAHCGQLREVWT